MAKETKNITTTLYLVGVLLAVVMGIGVAIGAGWAGNRWLVFLLVLVGLVAGSFNITAREVLPFLIGTVALIVASDVANLQAIDTLIPRLGTFLYEALEGFTTVIGAAAVVVAFKAVYAMAK